MGRKSPGSHRRNGQHCRSCSSQDLLIERRWPELQPWPEAPAALKQLGLPLSLKSLHRMMQLNDMTDMDYEEETDQIEEESETLVGMMVHGTPLDTTDESFLDTEGSTGVDPVVPGDETVPPADPAPTEPPAHTLPAQPAKSVPITPHRRGQPKPLKRKVGPKGASAGKA